ncbi:MAG: helix-turn-helix domain-containing protein [Sandaracinaceae bacterium]|nr:helix-turn-helix domain-containing protein [Sandaracinaceae bacterium]
MYQFAMTVPASKASVATPSGALTIRQVAERLSVNERTVYRMAQSGELPAFKVAGTWRVLRTDLDAWIEKQKAIATGEGPTGER